MNITWIIEKYILDVESVNHDYKQTFYYYTEEKAYQELQSHLQIGQICKLTKISHAE